MLRNVKTRLGNQLMAGNTADVLGPSRNAGFSASSLVHDDSLTAYLAMVAPAEPVPITGEPTTETDVVLTRRAGGSRP